MASFPAMTSEQLVSAPPNLVQQCQHSTLGKCLPGAFYVHISTLRHLDKALQQYEAKARPYLRDDIPLTLVKFHFEQPKLSYLYYPDFDQVAHPALHASIQVSLVTGQLHYRDYSQTPNPPVLHRKETFVAPDYPRYQDFVELTRQQEAFGLLDNSRVIGTQQGWQARLQQHKLIIHDHALACPLTPKQAIAKPKIERHKAAIVRKALSKPVRLALEAGLFTSQMSFFDYGCGHGGDVSRIGQKGFQAMGWDPFYQPNSPQQLADIVNLGYVINVIEDLAERREALLQAWQLTQRVMIVAAQVLVADSRRGLVAYEDGIITRRNTFQKYYEQEELKAYIDQVLGVDAIPAALGIYFVFRDPSQAEAFRASRFRSRATMPRVRLSVKRFEECKALLQPLMDFVTERGRVPTADELLPEQLEPLTREFGSVKRAFNVVVKVTDTGEWDAIATKRRQDLLVYLALSHFGKRPKLRDLSPVVQNDIKALFSSYRQACTAADLMLLSLGNLELLANHCQQSTVGKQMPDSLWVHLSALEKLDPLLRLYEGCVSRTLGRPIEATVVKLNYTKPQITYLFFPDFDNVPHPILHTSMKVGLQDLQVRYRDFDPQDDPPILLQKELLLSPDYPNYDKFAKLSRQEQDWGVLDGSSYITLNDWNQRLDEQCTQLQGYRLAWRKDADPYTLKLRKSQVRARQRVKSEE
ncbi:DNA phosphorothioation-associated putative methyltransferase [Leptolyngbya sp. Heron Island J]|uniref:DNA phosphorothioation-associated putative methyltransferase n=1 Tax=Leptolyngbya sp. Heron Island J TaxID=1385935 RepID=UPI0004CEE44B|nr:DNA phosphorothioation-associated putative methyltransferase [Leptolyngbya sp. Heron Island J]